MATVLPSNIMHYLFALLTASVAFGVLGCDTVTLDAPIGERLTRNERQPFVGRWTDDDAEVVDFRLTKDGELIAGSISWDEKQQQHLATDHRIDARRVGPVTYFLVTDHDDAQKYGFVRIERTGDMELKMYSPDPKKFRAAVRNGKLDGTIVPKKNDHFNVHLRVSSKLTEPFFAAPELGDWYDDELTQTFRCIKRFDAVE